MARKNRRSPQSGKNKTKGAQSLSKSNGNTSGKADSVNEWKDAFDPETSSIYSECTSVSLYSRSSCSVHSDTLNVSSGHKLSDSAGYAGIEDIAQLSDNYELELDTAFDQCCNATKKSRRNNRTRVKSIEAIRMGFLHGGYNHYLTKRLTTLTDILEQSLKQKSFPEELEAACSLLSTMLINIGDEATSLAQHLMPQLRNYLHDPTLSCALKAKCAQALSLSVFMTNCDYGQLEQSLSDLISLVIKAMELNNSDHKTTHKLNNSYEDLIEEEDDFMDESFDYDNLESFSEEGSIWNHQAKTKFASLVFASEMESFLSLCIELWAFLLSCSPDYLVQSQASKHLKVIIELLNASSLAIRIAAGECIALLVELIGEDFVNHFGIDLVMDLVEKLRQLSTDGQKFRGKRDLRKQRSSFRDILRTVEVYCAGGDIGAMSAKLGNMIRFGSERLELDSWAYERYYGIFCQVLGASLNNHLAQNVLLRDIFKLGPVVQYNLTTKAKNQDDEDYVSQKNQNKLERRIMNEAMKKARNVSIGKQRKNRINECSTLFN